MAPTTEEQREEAAAELFLQAETLLSNIMGTRVPLDTCLGDMGLTSVQFAQLEQRLVELTFDEENGGSGQDLVPMPEEDMTVHELLSKFVAAAMDSASPTSSVTSEKILKRRTMRLQAGVAFSQPEGNGGTSANQLPPPRPTRNANNLQNGINTLVADDRSVIAVIGASCRLPLGVSDPAAFFDYLSEKMSSFSYKTIKSGRHGEKSKQIYESTFRGGREGRAWAEGNEMWPAYAYTCSPNLLSGDRNGFSSLSSRGDHVGQAASSSSLTYFDYSFFQMSESEVIHMDLQHQLLLELSWECLYDAGVKSKDALKDSSVAVYVGQSSMDYAQGYVPTQV